MSQPETVSPQTLAHPLAASPGPGAPATPPSGTVQILGDYELLQKLGEGGMGVVYKARHTKLKRVVAVKLMHKHCCGNPQTLARFEREIESIGQVDHPNIVRAMDARDIDGTWLLVMEYVVGVNLHALLHRHGALRIPDACELVRQAALGLQCIHENGLIHRDVKPSNLILTTVAQPVVKILDLGLALLTQTDASGADGGLTSTGAVMGTPDYLAPEQATDSHRVDIRADLYSLGCTLYELLAGRAPFSNARYASHVAKILAHVRDEPPPIAGARLDVPPDLARFLGRLMAKRRDDRPAAPREVADALAPFAAGANLGALSREYCLAEGGGKATELRNVGETFDHAPRRPVPLPSAAPEMAEPLEESPLPAPPRVREGATVATRKPKAPSPGATPTEVRDVAETIATPPSRRLSPDSPGPETVQRAEVAPLPDLPRLASDLFDDAVTPVKAGARVLTATTFKPPSGPKSGPWDGHWRRWLAVAAALAVTVVVLAVSWFAFRGSEPSENAGPSASPEPPAGASSSSSDNDVPVYDPMHTLDANHE